MTRKTVNHAKRKERLAALLALTACALFAAYSCAGCAPIDTHDLPPLPEVQVDRDGLETTVKHLSTLEPRPHFGNPEVMDEVARGLQKKLEGYGFSPTLQEFEADGFQYANVSALYRPAKLAGAENPPRVVVGAHYDVAFSTPGADDNASGVAGVLELAQLIARHKPALDYEIEFVAYALEEPPFFSTERMGSFVHAKSLHEAGVNVRAMICLEMIGYFTEEPDSQEYPAWPFALVYPETGNFIGVVGNFGSGRLVVHVAGALAQTSLPVERLTGPASIPGVDFSDHRSYWAFDIPAVIVTDTAFYRNPNYHEATDTAETLDYDKMAEVVRGLYGALTRFP